MNLLDKQNPLLGILRILV